MTAKKNNCPQIHHLPRLQWACRRGMLELDVLLGKFLEGGYADLTDEDKTLFIRLLESPDPELFAWLMGAAVPAEPELAKIVRMIRHHGKSDI